MKDEERRKEKKKERNQQKLETGAIKSKVSLFICKQFQFE
jgi:hypothetical protein